MVSLERKGLLAKGEYFVVGIDIEQYDPSNPDKYLRGLLLEKIDLSAEVAFQSYVGIFPTATVSFAKFAKEVIVECLYICTYVCRIILNSINTKNNYSSSQWLIAK